MPLEFPSGRKASVRQVFRSEVVDTWQAVALLSEELTAARERAAVPDLSDADRLVASATVDRLARALAGMRIAATIVLDPKLPPPDPSLSLAAQGLAVCAALVERGWTVGEIDGLDLAAQGALLRSLGMAEPVTPTPIAPALPPYPSAAAWDRASAWLTEARERGTIGPDELTARVAERALGNPMAWTWPEWGRLGQDTLDVWAALVLADAARGVR